MGSVEHRGWPFLSRNNSHFCSPYHDRVFGRCYWYSPPKSFVSWDYPSHLAKETESQVSWLAQGHTVKGTGIQTSTVIGYSVAFHSVSITSFWDPLPGYLSLASSTISSIFYRQSGRGSPRSQIYSAPRQRKKTGSPRAPWCSENTAWQFTTPRSIFIMAFTH